MVHQFRKHYTRAEANALLPQIRQWLERFERLRQTLDKCEKRLGGLMSGGNDVGGESVNLQVRTLAEMNDVLTEFRQREIQIKPEKLDWGAHPPSGVAGRASRPAPWATKPVPAPRGKPCRECFPRGRGKPHARRVRSPSNFVFRVKDLERGLIDFPAIVGGREAFLCWEKDEENVEFWHDLEAGYAGREKL